MGGARTAASQSKILIFVSESKIMSTQQAAPSTEALLFLVQTPAQQEGMPFPGPWPPAPPSPPSSLAEHPGRPCGFQLLQAVLGLDPRDPQAPLKVKCRPALTYKGAMCGWDPLHTLGAVPRHTDASCQIALRCLGLAPLPPQRDHPINLPPLDLSLYPPYCLGRGCVTKN